MEAATEQNKTVADGRKAGSFQIIVFKQGNEEYALSIDQIKEVVITPTITRMPQTLPYIKGVANIRGNIIAILDLEEKFNIKRPADQHTGNHYTLVVESEDFKMGVLVREVPNTLTISAADFDESMNIITDVTSESNYVRGIVKVQGRLIILIDIFKVIGQDVMAALRKNTAA
ncbi:chemotaxis protein CheW [Parachryseolinea silvisoli]|jgi:purine-binding chemotaxis protein CheW|uniref:chemotaxis protein CheW n=1 Tax=Parachryseolinea silvisoli TaxID=2873601 RepID=UPI002265ACF5|nr:chemotaxis protein CheW [Parachryseolinea silvisoli]MCD9015858.1 chemotaxis protein CheW [Parachryseolinea silvisoli]